MIAVIDTSALVETADARAPLQGTVAATMLRSDLTQIVPAMVVAEASSLIAARLGTGLEARFLVSMADVEVEAPLREDWARISQPVHQYRDLRLGGTDASVIVLAKRLGAELIITRDRRHFTVVRPRHVPAFRLLPD